MPPEDAAPDPAAVWPPPPTVPKPAEASASGMAFLSLLPLSRWVARGMGACILFGVFALATDPIRSPSGQELGGIVAIFQVLAFVTTAVLFLRWTHRAYKNLAAFGTYGLHTTPGWAVGYFFVPIVNLYKPLVIFSEMWRASTPDTDTSNSLAWGSVRVPGLLMGWWLCWVLHGFLDRAVFSQAFRGSGGTPDPVLSAASDGTGIVAAVLAILVVRRLSARQQAKRDGMLL